MRTDGRAPRRLGIAAVAVMAIALGACGDGTDPASGDTVPPVTTPAAPAAGPAGAWRLSGATVGGAPIDATADELARATLVIEDGRIGGVAFCNSYGGNGRFHQDGTFAITELSMTEMGCEPGHLMELERVFADHLMSATSWALAGDALTVSGATGDWTFVREAPVEPAALAGTEWVLDTLIEGDAASNHPGMDSATLVFGEDGSLNGSTGCRTLAGRWSQQGSSIVVTELALEGTCPADLEALDSSVVGVLERMTVAIVGERLTLTAGDGTGLSYRAA